MTGAEGVNAMRTPSSSRVRSDTLSSGCILQRSASIPLDVHARGRVDIRRDATESISFTEERVERIQKDLRRELEEEIEKGLSVKISQELAAKMAAQEAERERLSRESEEERRRDREAFQEVMRSVLEVRTKDSEEIALIKARLEEEEAARRAGQEEERKEYERRLDAVRAEALAETERRLETERQDTLRRAQEETEERERRQAAEQAERERTEAEEREARREACLAGPVVHERGPDDGENSRTVMGSGTVVISRMDDSGHEDEAGSTQGPEVLQKLAAETAQQQRLALEEFQKQLREDEARRLESQAAWEARQALEEARAKEERRAELESIEKLKQELEEGKLQADRELDLRSSELRQQMEALRALQDKAEAQERRRLEAEKAAEQQKEVEKAAGQQKEAEKESDIGDIDDIDDTSSLSSSTSTDASGGTSGGSRDEDGDGNIRAKDGQAAPGVTRDTVVKRRDNEATTGSRLAQVEGALAELAHKQMELERREKELEEIQSAMVKASRVAVEDDVSHTTYPEPQGDIGTDSPPVAVADSGLCNKGSCVTDDGDGSPIAAELGKASSGAEEWIEYWDESAGASYFYNAVTKEASWTNPCEGMVGGAESALVGTSASLTAPNSESLPRSENATNEQWTECIDKASGMAYFYNVDTGEATWERPPEMMSDGGADNMASQFDKPENWVCFLDESSGKEYWFNVSSGETRWGTG